MERPDAIVWFERCYLAAVGLKLVTVVLNWATVDPGASQISLIVSLLLWFGVTRQHSGTSRWIIVVLFVVSAILGAYHLLLGAYDRVSVIFVVVALVLNALACFHLLRPNADSWFQKPPFK